jgi:hypothetical protein
MRSACETKATTPEQPMCALRARFKTTQYPTATLAKRCALREKKPRNTIRNFTLDLLGEALVVELSGAAFWRPLERPVRRY